MALAERLSRYRDLAVFVAKYGRADFVAHAGLEPVDSHGHGTVSHAEAFARDLEALGPTFIKLGQLLSTRADLLPPAYLDALARLQDDLEPFPFADVERIVEEELGVRALEGVCRIRAGADRRRVARPGASRGAARRP